MPEPEQSCLILPTKALGASRQWLLDQPCPVIAYGDACPYADVVVATQAEANQLGHRVEQFPMAALALVQVLRLAESLTDLEALDVESMAYATLQGGAEFQRWHASRVIDSAESTHTGPPILLERRSGELLAQLNRPEMRNSMTVEMRDGWMEMLDVLEHDTSIARLTLSGSGSCFSVGGELSEFGSRPDTARAHWVRTLQSPARKLVDLGSKVVVHVHGACIGSGIELPAFASQVSAHPRTFFQLPELAMGLIPGAGGTVSVTRRIGRQRTAWLVLSGRRINARAALDWGLVDQLHAPSKGVL